MNLLDWINQGIDGMTQVAGPGMDSLGFRIFIALLTTMMVWFGVQEALSSSQGGAAAFCVPSAVSQTPLVLSYRSGGQAPFPPAPPAPPAA